MLKILIAVAALSFATSTFASKLLSESRVCESLFSANRIHRVLTQNYNSEYLITIHFTQDGHDFSLNQIKKDKSIFNVVFKELDGQVYKSYKQEYIPAEQLSSLEKNLNQKLIEKFNSPEFYKIYYDYYFEGQGYLLENGLDRNYRPLPSGPNPHWRDDPQIIKELDQKVKHIIKNGVELGYWIVEDKNGKLHSDAELVTSLLTNAIIHNDSLPSLEKLIYKNQLSQDQIKAIHFYHLHPLGSPLSSEDIRSQIHLDSIPLSENVEFHIYALRLNSDKTQIEGVFHHSKLRMSSLKNK